MVINVPSLSWIVVLQTPFFLSEQKHLFTNVIIKEVKVLSKTHNSIEFLLNFTL